MTSKFVCLLLLAFEPTMILGSNRMGTGWGENPTFTPTAVPSALPTADPTHDPTTLPSSLPTADPTLIPTLIPTLLPTADPTVEPSAQAIPVPTPTPKPITGLGSRMPVPFPAPTPGCDWNEVGGAAYRPGNVLATVTVDSLSECEYLCLNQVFESSTFTPYQLGEDKGVCTLFFNLFAYDIQVASQTSCAEAATVAASSECNSVTLTSCICELKNARTYPLIFAPSSNTFTYDFDCHDPGCDVPSGAPSGAPTAGYEGLLGNVSVLDLKYDDLYDGVPLNTTDIELEYELDHVHNLELLVPWIESSGLQDSI